MNHYTAIIYSSLNITVVMYKSGSLVPRLISQAFHTASDKSLGDKPGNEATRVEVNLL